MQLNILMKVKRIKIEEELQKSHLAFPKIDALLIAHNVYGDY